MGKYASAAPARIITFQMLEETLKDIVPGREITIWVPQKKTDKNPDGITIVSGKIKKIYPKMILILVEARPGTYYRECFLKVDLLRYKILIK